MKKTLSFFILIFSFFQGSAQGTWSTLMNLSPRANGGEMMLLTDGTVICKSYSGIDYVSSYWDRLRPDSLGSYANGTWDTIPPMHDTRWAFSSQILRDGRVYIAGGEYGTGYATSELYNPVLNTWTLTSPPGDSIDDGESRLLPDGKILQAIIDWGPGGGTSASTGNRTTIFDPVTGSYVPGPSCISFGGLTEASWVKLPDNSILMVDCHQPRSERYIPSSNIWVNDAWLPVMLWTLSGEIGPGLLLPDGRAFFLGATNKTAYYTPSGSTSPGIWAAGPDIPSGQGSIDGAAAMMPNGKILCITSDTSSLTMAFPSPTYFLEFDYISNKFTPVSLPPFYSSSHPCQEDNLLVLPDGSVLHSTIGSRQYDIYTPTSAPLSAGKPTVTTITPVNCDTFKITGTLFNGISEGAVVGDDAQMATNFPMVRIKSGLKVYYARTFNWNRTGVMTGSLPDTAYFTLPSGLPNGTYPLEVVVNGNPSVSRTFNTCGTLATEVMAEKGNAIFIYPNPATTSTAVIFTTLTGGAYTITLADVYGRVVKRERINAIEGENTYLLSTASIPKGVYIIDVAGQSDVYKTKFTIE